MSGLRTAVLLIVGLSSICSAAGASMDIVSVRPAHPLEGGQAKVRVRFTNASDRIMAVRPGKRRYGALEDHGDVVALNELSQSASAPVFYMASNILLPGQSREEVIAADALGEGVAVEREVFLIDAAASVYGSSGRTGSQTSFSRLTPDELEQRLAKARVGRDGELVILGAGSARLLKAARAVKLWPREFSFADARRDFPNPPRAARWSRLLSGWLLDFPDATQLVGRHYATPLPIGSYEFLRESENAPGPLRFHLARPEATELAKNFKTVPGDGMYTRGTFIEVPRDRLAEALRAARTENLVVGRTTYFLDEYYYEFRPAKGF